MRIGYTNDSYPEQRTILGDNPNEMEAVKSFNHYFIGATLNRLPIVKKYSRTVFHETLFNTKKVDGVHFFNSVTAKDIPWVSTYETCIPRVSQMSFLTAETLTEDHRKEIKNAEKYVKLLASDNCRKLIALSKNNQEIQKDFLSHFPQYEEAVLQKMTQIYPPQKKLVERFSVEERTYQQPIRFIFVGKFFNLKGGNEIVDVFDKIYRETDHRFELLLVSLEDMKNYAFGDYGDNEAYLQASKEKIENCPHMKLVSYIENSELLKMLSEYDVGILPTWADTFGYSVLEMQAAGCPVITTNVRALDELNNEESGWKVRLPLNKHKEVAIKSQEEKDNYRKLMQTQLENIILGILENPEQIHQKALNAYDKVTQQHSVEGYYQALNDVYQESFR